MDKKLITYDKIKEIYRSKKYSFYTGIYNLNFFGVRTLDTQVNVFNDWLGCAYTDESKIDNEQLFVAQGTTDPGFYWLEHPMNVNGTAILKEGQYPSMWTIGMHAGKYEALVQVNQCTVYRDSDRDDNLDLTSDKTDIGRFGINFHHASMVNDTTTNVGQYSAGCQVFASLTDFNKMLKLAHAQVDHKQGKFYTYTLLNEKDF